MDMLMRDCEVTAFREAHGEAAQAPIDWAIAQLQRIGQELDVSVCVNDSKSSDAVAVGAEEQADSDSLHVRSMCAAIRQGLCNICAASVALLQE